MQPTTTVKQDSRRAKRAQEQYAFISRGNWLYRLAYSVAFPVQEFIAKIVVALSLRSRVDRRLNPSEDFQRSYFYQQMLAAEARYWSNPLIGRHDSVHDNQFHPERSPNLTRYWNECTTGDPDKTWLDHLRERGPFRRVLCLGLFPELPKYLASGIADEWVVNDLTHRDEGHSLAGAANITFISEDLNFARFPENHFDLIICHDVLHHIIRIEDLIEKINRALTDNGLFALIDYIGENRFLWNRPKKKAMNDFLKSLPLRAARFPFASEVSTQLIPLSPFEAVRSADILPVLEKTLRPQSVRAFFPLMFPLLTYLKGGFLKNDNPIVDRLIFADRDATAWGIRPSFVAGLYGKKSSSRPVCR